MSQVQANDSAEREMVARWLDELEANMELRETDADAADSAWRAFVEQEEANLNS